MKKNEILFTGKINVESTWIQSYEHNGIHRSELNIQLDIDVVINVMCNLKINRKITHLLTDDQVEMITGFPVVASLKKEE